MATELDTAEVTQILNEQLGRPVPMIDELLEAMRLNLWPSLEAQGYDEEPCKPRSYHYAGEQEIGKRGWPAVVVGGSFNTTEFGMGHMDEAEIAITAAMPPEITRRQLRRSYDIVCVARAILYHPTYRANHRDETDSTKVLWTELHPAGFRIVPADFKFYSGWQARFIVRQAPGSNLWT